MTERTINKNEIKTTTNQINIVKKPPVKIKCDKH